MVRCKKCGASIADGDAFCPLCGESVNVPEALSSSSAYPNQPTYQNQPAYPNQPTYQSQPAYPNQPMYQNQPVEQNSGMETAIKIFMIIGCVFNAFIYLISLAWTIPMTVYVFTSFKEHRHIGTGFKVCTLIFVNIVAGILLLCMKDEPRYRY